jgi:hypothetical protein
MGGDYPALRNAALAFARDGGAANERFQPVLKLVWPHFSQSAMIPPARVTVR